MSETTLLCLKVFFVAFFVTLVTTPMVMSLASRLGVLDYPGEVSMHTKPTPRMGGVAVFLGFALPVFLFCDYEVVQGVLVGGTIIFLIGLLDDIRGLSAAIKLLLIVVVTCILSHYGVMLSVFSSYYVNFFITVLWITAVVSAFNAVDNMNGLACGLAFISALGYFLVAFQVYQWQWGFLALAVMGSTLAFLRYNFSNGSIFLGDSGAFFLGFVLAVLGVIGEWSTNPVKACVAPMLILSVVNADLAFTIISRYRQGVAVSLYDSVVFRGKDHLSHRLVSLGLSPRLAVLFMYLLSLCVVIGAVVLRNSRPVDAVLLLIQCLFIFLVVVWLLSVRNRERLAE
ncbi:MAG: undecaprenyl/decaprenyl-phosphate alpha-N-acetylglucosaminyl 1-phosphate transferase [Planctomycetes bacterium]|nr:undecaprenyl/decaprenyl-phosphate alpha-N-acetylglucosaminyl 1-phosphate transferase [Planctomycetota bacterium]